MSDKKHTKYGKKADDNSGVSAARRISILTLFRLHFVAIKFSYYQKFVGGCNNLINFDTGNCYVPLTDRRTDGQCQDSHVYNDLV